MVAWVIACLAVVGSVSAARKKQIPAHFDPSLPEPHTQLELHPIENAPGLRRSLRTAEMTPLFPGYGTHYAYAYVGSPPQRQSLIIDTGSHYTAFPCTGCKQCGEHTDAYFDVAKSKTANVPKCLGNQHCPVSQGYTEGSSWHGYKVEDTLWIGAEQTNLLPGGSNYAVNFTFACQTEETGLFRTQLADGIMGMSAADDTLPMQLFKQKVVDSKVFALCFRAGGGILTLGGVNQQIHARKAVSYAKLQVRAGWYGVILRNIRFIDPKSNEVTELFPSAETTPHRLLTSSKPKHSSTPTTTTTTTNTNSNNNDNSHSPAANGREVSSASTSETKKSTNLFDDPRVNGDKGVIVDSGTTDTYLPQVLAEAFTKAFKVASKGVAFAPGNIRLTPEQLALLPDIAFDLLAVHGPGAIPNSTLTSEVVTVRMPKTAYVDSVGDDKYTFRVYLTEKSGGVLGANFMSDLNVIFDATNGRLGLVKSTCNYAEFATPLTSTPTVRPTKAPKNKRDDDYDGEDDDKEDEPQIAPLTCDKNLLVPYTQCSARCNQENEAAYRVEGTQSFVNECVFQSFLNRNNGNNKDADKQDSAPIAKPCVENCTYAISVRGDAQCPDTPWTECSHACITTRKTVPFDAPLFTRTSSSSSSSHRNKEVLSCNYKEQTAACYTGQCPRQDGDFLVYVDMHVRIASAQWSYVYAESFYAALASLFPQQIKSPHVIELLQNSNGGARDQLTSSRLHFQLRLKRRDFKSELLLHDAAEFVVMKLRSADFSRSLVSALDKVSVGPDRGTQRRFGWLYPEDVSVLSAVAMPIGDVRNPYIHGGQTDDDNHETGLLRAWHLTTTMDLLLLGAALAVLLVLGFVVCLHLKLREEYALLSKDKSHLARSSTALKKLWTRFADMAARTQQTFGVSGQNSSATASQQQRAFEAEMSQRGLLSGGARGGVEEEDLEFDDDEDMAAELGYRR